MSANQEKSNQPKQDESSQLLIARTNLETLIGDYGEYRSIYEDKILPSIRGVSRYLSTEELKQLRQDTQQRIELTADEGEQESIQIAFNSLINNIEQDPERVFHSDHTVDGGYFQFYFKDCYGQVIGLQQPSRLIAWTNKRE